MTAPPPGEAVVLLHDAGERRWRLYRRPERILVANRTDDVIPLLREVDREAARGRSAAGFLAYESAPAFDPALVVCEPDAVLPLAWFGIYADSEPFAFPAFAPAETAPPPRWEPSVSREAYAEAIAAVRACIHAGDTYQVNYAYRLRAPLPGDPWPLFVRMIHAQGGDYGAFVSTHDWAVCSASPEMFFTLRDGELVSRPMKGTARRGLWPADDLARAEGLRRSVKNRAENVMIVDMVRNDLGRVAAPGSVEATRLFDVERYATLWQMTSTVRCRTTAGVTDVLRALFPAASITGAPKVRTMQIIAERERAPRGIYTGAIGCVHPGGSAQFSVAIRTVRVNRNDGRAEYGVGGGIVWDSEAADEFEECRTKARVLTAERPPFSLLETLRWTPAEGCWLLDRHMQRLAASAAYFMRPFDADALRERIGAAVAALPAVPHRVRVELPDGAEPCVAAEPLARLPDPYRVRLAARPVDPADVFLYHKTTRRRAYEQARAETPDADDVLLWNEHGEVTESCIANVIVHIGGRRVTPPVKCGLLPGTYREELLARGEVLEASVGVGDLARADAIWLANSVRGLWQATWVP